jgi:hypothetical protein
MKPASIPTDATLGLIKRGMMVVLSLACAFQLLFVTSGSNAVLAVIYCAAGSILLLSVFDKKQLSKNPMSSLLVMGFGFTHFFLPLVFTSLVGRSVAFKMKIPHLVFGWAVVTFLCLILFHKAYCNVRLIKAGQKQLQERILMPLGLFRAPQESQLWAMGLLGLSATFIGMSGGEKESPGILIKILDGFRPFSFAPFMLLVQPVWGSARKLGFATKVGLAGFTGMMFFIAMASGSRAYVVFGFASAGLIYFLGICLGRIPMPKIRLVPILLAAVLSVVLVPLLLRAFSAAKFAASSKATSTLSQRFDVFINVFQNTEGLKKQEESAVDVAQTYDLWEEDYAGIEFFNRLSNPRLHDHLMKCVYELSNRDLASIRQLDFERGLATMPDPLLKFFGIRINKEFVISGSVSDYIWLLKFDNPWTFGEFKAGSLMASTYCYVGQYFPVMIALMALPFFFISDLLAIRIRMGPNGFRTIIPVMLGLQAYHFFSTFSTATLLESPSGLFGAATRGYLQSIILYLLVLHGTSLLRTQTTKKGQRRITRKTSVIESSTNAS